MGDDPIREILKCALTAMCAVRGSGWPIHANTAKDLDIAIEGVRSALSSPLAAPGGVTRGPTTWAEHTAGRENPGPEPEWWPLRQFGYAPGNYIITCGRCGGKPWDCDKRAMCCRPCAEKALASAPLPPPVEQGVESPAEGIIGMLARAVPAPSPPGGGLEHRQTVAKIIRRMLAEGNAKPATERSEAAADAILAALSALPGAPPSPDPDVEGLAGRMEEGAGTVQMMDFRGFALGGLSSDLLTEAAATLRQLSGRVKVLESQMTAPSWAAAEADRMAGAERARAALPPVKQEQSDV